MPPPERHAHTFHPKDAVSDAGSSAFKTGVVGAMFSGIQATLTKQNIGAFGAVTRYGSTTVMFAVAGGSYTFVRDVTSNLREKDDWKSSLLGGITSGALLGAYRRSIPSVIGIGALMGISTAILTASGGELRSHVDPERDVVAEREALRKNYRTPSEQTIAELGEGRGIYGAGYAERRKERLKQNYGVDIP